MSWYHPSMYDTAQPAGSFWEEEAPPLGLQTPPPSSERCDIAIIGGGYTGLAAAYYLARDTGLDVHVLEAGTPGWGASGRNGGFCALHPSSLSLTRLIKKYGLSEAQQYMRSQREAVDHVAELVERERIDVQRRGQGYFEVAHHPGFFSELAEKEEQMRRQFSLPVRLYSADEFADIGYRSTEQFGALHVDVGFGLHPLRFARGLARAAARQGARLHGNAEVRHWDKSAGWHQLSTDTGTLAARYVIVATNGYTKENLHSAFAGTLMPIVSNILVTRPLSEQELAAQSWVTDTPCSNTRNLLFYFRLLPDRRFLFGARGDLTGKPEDSQAMRTWLTRRFGEVFPAWAQVEVTHFWRGFVCMTRNLTPMIGALGEDPSIFYALAYHGDGVAAAPWAGATLARLLRGEARLDSLPAPLQGQPRPFPFPALRPWYLKAAIKIIERNDNRPPARS